MLSDYDGALKHLNEQYGLSMVEYKFYHPNLLRNDNFIKSYQKYILILMLLNQKGH